MLERIKERRKLIRPLLVPCILYIGLLAFSTNWATENPESPWRVAVALTPMLPGIVIAFGVVRAIMQLDELERKALLEGLAVSFMGTLMLVMSMGLLSAAGIVQLNGAYIALFMVVLWFIGKLWATRRYQ